jgi:hypothetical protein
MTLAYLADELGEWLRVEGVSAFTGALLAVGGAATLIIVSIGFLWRGTHVE